MASYRLRPLMTVSTDWTTNFEFWDYLKRTGKLTRHTECFRRYGSDGRDGRDGRDSRGSL